MLWEGNHHLRFGEFRLSKVQRSWIPVRRYFFSFPDVGQARAERILVLRARAWLWYRRSLAGWQQDLDLEALCEILTSGSYAY
jgi:hypothetical protein